MFLLDDADYHAPTFAFANHSRRLGAPAYLYQFEYDGIGDAWAHFPVSSGSDPAFTPRHSQDLVGT